jgi:AcrR family transcriptional regulator
MSRLEAERKRVRAGGRSERIRRQVAQATLDLLGEGRADLGPAEVAARAGISRATLHRWWPAKADLVREALAEHTRRLDPPDTGSWEGDLRALVAQLAAFFADPVEVSQNAIMASGRHPDYDALVFEHYGPLFAAWRAVVERGRARGDVRADVDPDVVVAMVTSPLLVGPLVMHHTPAPDELDRMVDFVLAATAPR